jgi:hypothetical protein
MRGRRFREAQPNAPNSSGSQGRFTCIGFEPRSCCPPGFRCWAGKREVYQVLRLFFTGPDPLPGPSLNDQLAAKCNRKNEEIHNQNGGQGIFLISSFNLYASFALLGIVRFTQTTVSSSAAWLPSMSLAAEAIRVFTAA